MVKITIKGTKEVANMFKNKRKKIADNSNKGVIKASFYIQGEVKSSIAGRRAEPTSVDTGRFLNSVDVTTSKNTGVVFSDIGYAKHLEYGTSRINARQHFRNTKFRNEKKVKEIIEVETKNA